MVHGVGLTIISFVSNAVIVTVAFCGRESTDKTDICQLPYSGADTCPSLVGYPHGAGIISLNTQFVGIILCNLFLDLSSNLCVSERFGILYTN